MTQGFWPRLRRRVGVVRRRWLRNGAALIALGLGTAGVAAAISAPPERLYHAVAVMPVQDLSSVDVRRLVGVVGSRPASSRERAAPLLPNGSVGLSQVIRRAAGRLRLEPATVSESVIVVDSKDDPPSFLTEQPRPRQLRVRSTAKDRRTATEIAGTLAREYVGYRREVLDQEAITAIQSLRARADILGASASADIRRRAEMVATVHALDVGRLGGPHLRKTTERTSVPTGSQTVVIGGIVGVVFGLLFIQLRAAVRVRPV